MGEQYDSAENLLRPLMDPNTKNSAAHAHPQTELRGMVQTARKVVKKVNGLVETASKSKYESQALAAVASEGLNKKKTELKAAKVAVEHARNAEGEAGETILELEPQLDSALTEWQKARRTAGIAVAESAIVSVDDSLKRSRDAVKKLDAATDVTETGTERKGASPKQ